MQGEAAVLDLSVGKRDSFGGAQWHPEYHWKGVEEMQMGSPQWCTQKKVKGSDTNWSPTQAGNKEQILARSSRGLDCL